MILLATTQSTFIEKALSSFSNAMWGPALLVLLLGGGFYFLMISKFLPFRYLKHAIDVLRGKYDDPNEEGELNHYETLSGAIAATVGLGNISGVAIAIIMGGPGALFWMWISAIVGSATKFFTCTLSIMYRGKDDEGNVQGGPMYVIMEGLGKKWKPLAVIFSLAGMIGTTPAFQSNQLTQIVYEVVVPQTYTGEVWVPKLIISLVILSIVALVILGGIQRIGNIAGKLVPVMVLVYSISVIYIILSNYEQIIPCFELIFSDAFSGEAVLGGAIGQVIIIGARRAAFSNEAGLGTAPMMHGAAKTSEPVREGLIAMLGPIIDTVIVCTMTALAILITGVWKDGSGNGIEVTALAFESGIPYVGKYILLFAVVTFSMTTLFTMSYYGTKCTGFVFGAKYQKYYNWFYCAIIIIAALIPLDVLINLIDGMYAVMAWPTMISTILLSKTVIEAAKAYFKKYEKEDEKLVDIS
ncbi:alanine/glycine:cation symporter family protein [Sediminitomix flava]|nr:alanine/glycine:cation symporter family protein [Sediminitomix flava]